MLQDSASDPEERDDQKLNKYPLLKNALMDYIKEERVMRNSIIHKIDLLSV